MKKAISYDALEDGEGTAELIISLIDEKAKLSGLWLYLDGVIENLDGADRHSLQSYASARGSVKNFDESVKREWRRAVAKFVRRARRLKSFAEAIKLVGKYYCLLSV